MRSINYALYYTTTAGNTHREEASGEAVLFSAPALRAKNAG